MKVKSKPDAIDKCVGKNLRLYRMMSGITQESLAASVDLTFQQIQKYELGQNRISASRMLTFSKILNVKITDFYKGLDEDQENRENLMEKLYSLDQSSLDFIRLYTEVKDKKTKKSLLNILKAMQKKHN